MKWRPAFRCGAFRCGAFRCGAFRCGAFRCGAGALAGVLSSFLLTGCVLSTLLLTGCATVIHRPAQPIFVDSRPAGASATIICGPDVRVSGTTPARLEIPRKARACQLRVESPGYETARLELSRGFSGGYWGNFGLMSALGLAVLLSGDSAEENIVASWAAGAAGASGFLIDRHTGRAWSHDPQEIIIDLERTKR